VQYLSFDIPLFFRLLFSRRQDVFVVEPPPTTGIVVRSVSAIRRIPYVYYAADVWSDASATAGAPRWVVRALRSVERLAFTGAREVIAVSDGVAARVSAIAPRAAVRVVRNGVDTTVFSPHGRVDDGPPRIVYAGTTSEWQGADVFVRAMPSVREHVPDAVLVYVGQGSAWVQLKQHAEEVAPGAVEFVDVVPPEEAAIRLRSAMLAVVSLKPGQGYDFAVPTKIFAALACGTPVVFAGPGPSTDIVTGALGRSVAWDPAEAASAIVELLTTSDADGRMTRAGWAEENASIAATGRNAAAIVQEAA
jgi:glycosyltransferase involved in cell wall biosynthesis